MTHHRTCTILAAAAFAVVPACSSHGGGGSAAPVLVSAVFAGSGPAPAAGDRLILFCSMDVALVPGALLDDADVTLSGGATLGAVSAPPALLGPRTVQVTLGAGVSFTPGSTTVAFQSGNDAVRSTSGGLAQGGNAVVIGASDGSPPTITAVTLNAIDASLNGTGAAGGTLQVPPSSFTIDLAYSDNTAVDPARTQILCSVNVATPSGTKTPGTDLRPFLAEISATSLTASYEVPPDVAFDAGPAVLTVYVVDATGLSSNPSSFSFLVKPLTDDVRPFETTANPSQVWYIDFSRDVESFSVAGTTVTPVAGPNGRSDFEDILLVLGLLAPSPIPNVQNGSNSNDVVLALFRSELLTALGAFYTGVNVQFTYSQPPGSFGSNSSVPYASLGFSRISVAGSSTTPGVLGVAIYDENNATQNDDTLTDFQGMRLGIFLHTMVADGLGQSSLTLFRQTFDPFTPAHGGTPIGGDSQDGARLTGALSDARASQISSAILGFARFTGVVLAHECGHSMGLVKNMPMPTGLYGNDAVNFPGSTDGHIRNQAEFPAGAVNVMSPALNYSWTQHAATAFNRLNIAYLREKALYDKTN